MTTKVPFLFLLNLAGLNPWTDIGYYITISYLSLVTRYMSTSIVIISCIGIRYSSKTRANGELCWSTMDHPCWNDVGLVATQNHENSNQQLSKLLDGYEILTISGINHSWDPMTRSAWYGSWCLQDVDLFATRNAHGIRYLQYFSELITIKVVDARYIASEYLNDITNNSTSMAAQEADHVHSTGWLKSLEV